MGTAVLPGMERSGMPGQINQETQAIKDSDKNYHDWVSVARFHELDRLTDLFPALTHGALRFRPSSRAKTLLFYGFYFGQTKGYRTLYFS